MNLNLPIFDQLVHARSILIAGMGGGFDIFCGLPIYFALKEKGFNVHLANYSFSDIAYLVDKGRGHMLTETLVGVSADIEGTYVYFPELYLSQWFKEAREDDVTIWSFHKTGVRPLIENYQALVEHLKIDAILVIDGGVDALLRGDEAQLGTLIEDSISLVAVNEIKSIQTKLMACVALGAERDMAYGHVMENIAYLNRNGAFFGACALTPQMDVYEIYDRAVTYVQNKPYQDPSVINSSILSSVRGFYGDYHLTEKTRGSKLWISPLMSLYWFFDSRLVARRNLLYDELRRTETITDAFRVGYLALKATRRTSRPSDIPL